VRRAASDGISHFGNAWDPTLPARWHRQTVDPEGSAGRGCVDAADGSRLQPSGQPRSPTARLCGLDREEEEFSGTASLAYHLNEDVMVYGGYSRGYKAGGYNVDRSGFAITPATTSSAAANAVAQLAFEPEFTDAYESRRQDDAVRRRRRRSTSRASSSRSPTTSSNAFNGFNFITRNVPDVISQGVEVEMTTNPIEGLNINAGVVYNGRLLRQHGRTFNAAEPNPEHRSAPAPR
jgi:outer membrane receptor protein involved in Fe transport